MSGKKTHQRPCDYHLLMFVQPLPFSMVATSNQSSKSEPIQKLIFPTFFNQLSFRGLFLLLNFCFQCSSKFECQFRSYVIRLPPLHGQTYINIYICKYIYIYCCFLEGHVIRNPSSDTHDLGFQKSWVARKKLMTYPHVLVTLSIYNHPSHQSLLYIDYCKYTRVTIKHKSNFPPSQYLENE